MPKNRNEIEFREASWAFAYEPGSGRIVMSFQIIREVGADPAERGHDLAEACRRAAAEAYPGTRLKVVEAETTTLGPRRHLWVDPDREAVVEVPEGTPRSLGIAFEAED